MKKISLLATILGFTSIQSSAFAAIYFGEDSYLENYELRFLAKAPKVPFSINNSFIEYEYEAQNPYTNENYLVQRPDKEGWDEAWNGSADNMTGLSGNNDSRVKATWLPDRQAWEVEYHFEDLDSAFLPINRDNRNKFYSLVFKKKSFFDKEKSMVPQTASQSSPVGSISKNMIIEEENAPRSVIAPLRKASKSRAAEQPTLSENHGIKTVTTDNSRQWMYQVESDSFPINPGDLLQVSYDITADEGGMIALDLLNSARSNWLLGPRKRVVLTQGNQKGTIEVKVPQGESETSLVFYNDKISSTPTQLMINSLTMMNTPAKK